MNRRTLLRLAASLAIVPTLRVRAAPETAGISPEMARLSEYMSAAARVPLPEDVAEQAKLHLLDTFAAMISGSALVPGQAALRYLAAHVAPGGATVVAANLTASAPEAALSNGTMAHADETDDSHERSRSHPGSAVVPSALAAGEEFSASGATLLRAVALGYDIGTRVAMALGGPRYSYQSHRSTHAIAAGFGAAAAAACTAGLDAKRMRWVLDYAAQQSAGIAAWQRDADHIEKAFVFAGMTARNGVTSALVVESGWSGIDDIFSGDDNFFLANAPGADPGMLIDGLGGRYEIAQTDIKKWSVGSPIQAPLDAIAAIRMRHPFSAADVERVTVRLAPSVAAVVDNRSIPDICLQHLITVMLLDGTVSFHAAHDPDRMRDAAVLAERRKVVLARDESLARYLPTRVAVVEVLLAGDILLSERVEAVRGTTRNPMSRGEVVAKCTDLIVPVFGPERCARLIEQLLAIETLQSVRALRPLLQRA